jgi:hypothetical protein
MQTHFNQDLNKSCIAEKFDALSLNDNKKRRKLSQYKDPKDQARKDGNFLSKSFKVDLLSYKKI